MTSHSTRWDGDLAIGHMARVQQALDLKGLSGHDPLVHDLLGETVAAFRARNLLGVKSTCERTLKAIERAPKPAPKTVLTVTPKPRTPGRATG